MPSQFPILVVDDDPGLLDILNQAAKSGFPEASFTQVYSTTEAKAYLNALDGYGLKLLLLDLNLQTAETGFDLLAFLRADAQTRPLPIIILTISQLASDLQTAYAFGASSFTVKPDCLQGWITYLSNLRLYWVNTVTLPPIQFTKKQ